MEDLMELIDEFEGASGTSELDLCDPTMREQLDNLSNEDIEELKEAFRKLTSFYMCIY